MSAFDSRINTYTDTDVVPDMVDPKIYGHFKSKTEIEKSTGKRKRLWTFEDPEGLENFIRHVKAGMFRRAHDDG